MRAESGLLTRRLCAWACQAPRAWFFDFDGTLSPIVREPDLAALRPSLRSALRHLAERHRVAFVSGRALDDLVRKVALPGVSYVGSHGFEIRTPTRAWQHPGAVAAEVALERYASRLPALLSDLTGWRVERKRFAVALHVRRAPTPHKRAAAERVRSWLAGQRDLRAQPGKEVIDVVPNARWDKGRAVTWLLHAWGPVATTDAIYFGDDHTDVHAFRALSHRGITVGVGGAPASRRADLWSPGPRALEQTLRAVLHPGRRFAAPGAPPDATSRRGEPSCSGCYSRT